MDKKRAKPKAAMQACEDMRKKLRCEFQERASTLAWERAEVRESKDQAEKMMGQAYMQLEKVSQERMRLGDVESKCWEMEGLTIGMIAEKEGAAHETIRNLDHRIQQKQKQLDALDEDGRAKEIESELLQDVLDGKKKCLLTQESNQADHQCELESERDSPSPELPRASFRRRADLTGVKPEMLNAVGDLKRCYRRRKRGSGVKKKPHKVGAAWAFVS